MSILFYLSISLYLLVCVLLTIVVLMQESKSSGIGSAFGVGDPTQSIFGTSTADVLKKVTGWLSFGFLFLALVLSIWTSHLGKQLVSFPSEMEEIEGVMPRE